MKVEVDVIEAARLELNVRDRRRQEGPHVLVDVGVQVQRGASTLAKRNYLDGKREKERWVIERQEEGGGFYLGSKGPLLTCSWVAEVTRSKNLPMPSSLSQQEAQMCLDRSSDSVICC